MESAGWCGVGGGRAMRSKLTLINNSTKHAEKNRSASHHAHAHTHRKANLLAVFDGKIEALEVLRLHGLLERLVGLVDDLLFGGLNNIARHARALPK